jgi:hypothetical protein
MEVVALYSTGKTLTFADTNHIYALTNGKSVANSYFVADFQAMILGTKFAQKRRGESHWLSNDPT